MKPKSKQTPPVDRWMAVRRGPIYCAPACGAGCTHAAYKKACADGKKLAKSLGKGWESVVHENMGWHFRAVKGCAEVHKNSAGFFTAYFNSESGQISGHSNTACGGVKSVISMAKAKMALLKADLALLEAL